MIPCEFAFLIIPDGLNLLGIELAKSKRHNAQSNFIAAKNIQPYRGVYFFAPYLIILHTV
jgi:hypothetical protein